LRNAGVDRAGTRKKKKIQKENQAQSWRSEGINHERAEHVPLLVVRDKRASIN